MDIADVLNNCYSVCRELILVFVMAVVLSRETLNESTSEKIYKQNAFII